MVNAFNDYQQLEESFGENSIEKIEQRFAKYVYRHGNIDAQGILPCLIDPLKENPPL